MLGMWKLAGWSAALCLCGCVVIATTTVAACTTIPPECRTEYAHTISHCPDLQRRPANPEECKKIGVAVYKDGVYQGCASRQDIRDLMRTWPG
jgi:hypothetical protein